MRDPGSKRLAIIQTRLAPFRVPFFDRLAESGDLDVTVFVCHSRSRPESPLPPNLHRFRLFPLPCFRLIKRELMIQTRLPFAVLTGSFDTVVAEARLGLLMNIVVLILCRLAGKRFLWWTCGWERSEMESVTAGKRIVRSVLFRLANGGIAYSNAAKNYLIRLGMKPSRIWVAQNSIDTDQLIEIESQIHLDNRLLTHVRSQHSANGKFLVLFVGKLVGTKRVDLLIRAFSAVHQRVPDSVLWIVGDGPEKPALEQLAAGYPGLPIRFLGEITEPMTINAIYMACDVFTLPGTGGLAINQAMTFGRPIVVSTADGTEADLIADGTNGLYFKPGSVEDLAEKILNLYHDESLRRKMGDASRAKILTSVNMRNMVKGFRDAVFNIPPGTS